MEINKIPIVGELWELLDSIAEYPSLKNRVLAYTLVLGYHVLCFGILVKVTDWMTRFASVFV